MKATNSVGALKPPGQNVSPERALYVSALLDEWTMAPVFVIGASGGLAAVPGICGARDPEGDPVAVIVSLVALAYQGAYPRLSVIGRKPGTDVFRPESEQHA